MYLFMSSYYFPESDGVCAHQGPPIDAPVYWALWIIDGQLFCKMMESEMNKKTRQKNLTLLVKREERRSCRAVEKMWGCRHNSLTLSAPWMFTSRPPIGILVAYIPYFKVGISGNLIYLSCFYAPSFFKIFLWTGASSKADLVKKN